LGFFVSANSVWMRILYVRQTKYIYRRFYCGRGIDEWHQ